MGASNKFFLDTRQTEQQEQFDHNKKFKEKQKFTWFSSDDFARCKSMSLIELTETLTRFSQPEFKIDYQDKDELIKLIEEKEPNYISKKEVEYFKKILDSPLGNLKRVYKKYSFSITPGMSSQYKLILETEIKDRENEILSHTNGW